MQLVNLTPHAISVVSPKGETIVTLPPSGELARVSMETRPQGVISLGAQGDVPLVSQEPGPVEGLPDPAKGVGFVVSALVRLAVPERGDVFSPGPLVRGPDGQPVGCQGLTGNEAAPTPTVSKQGRERVERSLGYDGQSAAWETLRVLEEEGFIPPSVAQSLGF